MTEENDYKNKIKNKIKQLIEQNRIDEAKDLLFQYERAVEFDIDLYSMMGVLHMMEGNFEAAEAVLLEGIDLSPSNQDIVYNLAYLYEATQRIELAYKYYTSLKDSADPVMLNEVLIKLKQFEELDAIQVYIALREAEKIRPITIITWVYNSKEYVGECIDSVLNQSFKDFEWIILDNGCTDGSSEILHEIAQKDDRITLFVNERNHIVHNEPLNPKYLEYLSSCRSEYMCSVDCDDYLHRDFLKELYTAAKEFKADVAVAGTEMFLEEDTRQRGERIPPAFHTRDMSKVGDIIQFLYGSFRPDWGKLVRTDIYLRARDYLEKHSFKYRNGGDTAAGLYYLKHAKSLVSLNKILHYYRMRKNSRYSKVDKNRYLSYIEIYKEGLSLVEGWNKATNENKSFLELVLYHSLKDCIDITAKATVISLEDRIEVYNTILSNVELREILGYSGLYYKLLDDINTEIDRAINDSRITKY